MRVTITIPAGDAATVGVTADGGALPDRPVRWDGGLLLAAASTAGDAAELAAAVGAGTPSADQLARYGQLLFEAVLGAGSWAELVEKAGTDPLLELAVLAPPDSPAQALHWEALHDGTWFVAARGATRPNGTNLLVAVVRLVPAAGSGQIAEITHVPRVLFAVGSRLTDPDVRPGAEFMGILRQLEREGGAVQARTLESATVPALTRLLRDFLPDLLDLGRAREAAGPTARGPPPAPAGGGGRPGRRLGRRRRPAARLRAGRAHADRGGPLGLPERRRRRAGRHAVRGQARRRGCRSRSRWRRRRPRHGLRVFTRAHRRGRVRAPLVRRRHRRGGRVLGTAGPRLDGLGPAGAVPARGPVGARRRGCERHPLSAVRQRSRRSGSGPGTGVLRPATVPRRVRPAAGAGRCATCWSHTRTARRAATAGCAAAELGARAVRAGRLPLLLGPSTRTADRPGGAGREGRRAAARHGAANLGIQLERLGWRALPAGFTPRE